VKRELLTTCVLLIAFSLTTGMQCEKNECESGEFRLDVSRSWLPLKGKTFMTFSDAAGNLTNFNLQVYDSVHTSIDPDCGATTIVESIYCVLYLTTSNNPIIQASLNPPNSLLVSALNGTDPVLRVKDVFAKANAGIVAKRLTNHVIGNKTYQEVILIFQNPKTSNPIDSIFLANNNGIAGFSYLGKKYSLQ
jgi:hypothetical protein